MSRTRNITNTTTGLVGVNGDPITNINTVSQIYTEVSDGYHFIQHLEYGVNGNGVGYNAQMQLNYLC